MFGGTREAEGALAATLSVRRERRVENCCARRGPRKCFRTTDSAQPHQSFPLQLVPCGGPPTDLDLRVSLFLQMSLASRPTPQAGS